MPKKILIIAFHFPPIQGSSGVYRTLAFSKYLPAYGWEPTVLTAQLRAYDEIREENLRLLPPGLRVERAFALDTRKHLAFRGRYPEFLALPDRWQSWILGGIVRGLKLMRELKPDAIMSTYPIASAHLIGLALHRLTGCPWLADFRDPMFQDDFPERPSERKAFRWIEAASFKAASAITLTTAGTQAYYRERYPELTAQKVTVVPNGFDEEAFVDLRPPPRPAGARRPLQLLHSGLLYEQDRNPENFFAAIAELRDEQKLNTQDLRVVLRASGNESYYQRRLDAHGLGTTIVLAPPLGYQEALDEMLQSDGLLLFQATGGDKQIPAKAYEYLYARRPILGITAPTGDTGRLLQQMGIDTIAPLEDKDAIKHALLAFISAIMNDTYRLPPQAEVEKLSRRARTQELAQVLDRMCAARPTGNSE